MTFRKMILAGLLAALALPALANSPTHDDLARLPNSERFHAADPATNVTTARAKRGAPVDPKEVAADKQFSKRHWKAMQKGADHETASKQASD
jgi:hypothetical protein